MKPGCIIMHGVADDAEDNMYNKHWMQWTKKELGERGIVTVVPAVVEPWKPNYENYKKVFEKYEVDEKSVLVGHSAGCAFLVRWLSEHKKKVNKLILVAPWKIAREGDARRKAFYEYPINPDVRKQVKEIVIFTSNDEENDGKKSAQIFHRALGGKIVELKGHGHYTRDEMGTEEFPELVEEIISQ